MEHVQVCVREVLNAPVDTVWNLIRDFADISAWARGRVVRVDGAGVGMIRYVEGPSGPVVERCEARDDAAHAFSYRLLESPWPMVDYVASVRLSPDGADRCVIEWSASFETAVPDMRTRIESGLRDVFIANLRKRLAGGTP